MDYFAKEKMWRKIGMYMIIFGVVLSIVRGALHYEASYNYEKLVGNNWILSNRASNITQKADYLNKFVTALDSQHLQGLNTGLYMKTPEGDFNENLKAIKSLQTRLNDCYQMNDTSFAYQTAMGQIEQEQGGATHILDNLEQCWVRTNYPSLWNPWIFWLCVSLEVGLCVGGFITLLVNI